MSTTPTNDSGSSDRFPEFTKAAGAVDVPQAEAEVSEPEEVGTPDSADAEDPVIGEPLTSGPRAGARTVGGMNIWVLALCIGVPIACLVFNLIIMLRLQHRVDYLTTYSVDRVRDLVNGNRGMLPAVQAEIARTRRPIIPRSGVEGLGDLYSQGLKKPAEFRQTILDEFKTIDQPSYYAFLERFAMFDPDQGIREKAKSEVDAYIGKLMGDLYSSDKQHRMAAASVLGSDFHANKTLVAALASAASQDPGNDPGIYDSLVVLQRIDLELLIGNADTVKALISKAKGMTNERLHYAASLVEERLNGKALSGNLSEAN